MGQKVNPIILRTGIIRTWNSKWFAKKNKFGELFHQDVAVEKMIMEKLHDASISHLEIQRTANQVTINIFTAKPGVIIGRSGTAIEALKAELEKKFKDKFILNIKEVKKPALNARLLAENIARQIEKRVSYRRASKMAVEKAMEAGALGVKVFVTGRLNGVEIARSEFFSKGTVPLHTFRADIDYASMPAQTTYGTIGVKVWIYKGLVFKQNRSELEEIN